MTNSLTTFQNAMIEAPATTSGENPVQFPCWSLAGSSPVVEATRILRAMFEEGPSDQPQRCWEMHPCDWCTTLRGRENEKLAEFARELQRNNFRGWIMQYGTVCLFHGRRLIRVLSEDDVELIRRLLATNMQDLEKPLEASDVKVKRCERGGVSSGS